MTDRKLTPEEEAAYKSAAQKKADAEKHPDARAQITGGKTVGSDGVVKGNTIETRIDPKIKNLNR